MTPDRVYCENGHELWLADCLVPEHVELIMAGRKADLLCIDAPYSEKTHKGHDDGNARSASRDKYAISRNDVPYPHWSMRDVENFCALWCPRISGWCVSITDDALAPIWGGEFEAHELYRFTPLPLVETGSRVRLAGDGPSGWTCWVVVARPRSKEFASWGTLPGAYIQPRECAINSSDGSDRVVGGKPRKAMCRIVEDYSRRGDLVVDPTCGAGTTNMAAKMTGRRSIGIDTSSERLEIAARRLRDSREQRGLFDEVGT